MNCPLGKCTGDPHMIGIDGSLRHVKPFMINDMQLRGWRRVDNPKRNYYPEYDSQNPYFNNNKEIVRDDDILIVTKI